MSFKQVVAATHKTTVLWRIQYFTHDIDVVNLYIVYDASFCESVIGSQTKIGHTIDDTVGGPRGWTRPDMRIQIYCHITPCTPWLEIPSGNDIPCVNSYDTLCRKGSHVQIPPILIVFDTVSCHLEAIVGGRSSFAVHKFVDNSCYIYGKVWTFFKGYIC